MTNVSGTITVGADNTYTDTLMGQQTFIVNYPVACLTLMGMKIVTCSELATGLTAEFKPPLPPRSSVTEPPPTDVSVRRPTPARSLKPAR